MSGAAAIKVAGGLGDEWGTPADLWEDIWQRYFHGNMTVFDPCPNLMRILNHTGYMNGPVDGLKLNKWGLANFVNPPFSDITPWVARALGHPEALTVMLVPVRGDQPWWHYLDNVKIVFIRGRVNYFSPQKEKTTGASFPSCLLIFGGEPGVEFWWPECHRDRRRPASPETKGEG